MKKIPPSNLIEMLNLTAAMYPNQVALYCLDKKLTYAELASTSDRLAHGLQNLGLAEASRLGIFLSNSIEFIIAYFAIIKAGFTVVPINNMFKQPEAEFIIQDAQIPAVITCLNFLNVIAPLKSKEGYLKHLILIDGVTEDSLNFYEIIERTKAGLKPARVNKESVASILYTSGTTGQPKGAMLTHNNFLSNSVACITAIKARKSDNFICLLPMFHSFAWTVCVLMPLYIGASITIVDSLRPFRKIIRNVIKKKVSVFVGIPSIFHILAQMHIPAVFTARILKMIDPLRVCISGAAALPSEVLERFEAKFKVPLLEGYGLTEASPVVSLNPMRGARKPGSVGLVIKGVEVKIVAQDAISLPAGEIGELLVRGENVMQGYFKNAQATRETLKEGWLYTGDLSKMDQDGYIYIVDRKKEMINVRGLNVYPAEIEKLLLKHPKIKEAAVIGTKDRFKGEVPKAFIVIKEGEVLSRQEIIAYLRSSLAMFKIPKFIEFREGLPKTATGKVAKRQIT
ncbi:MAG: long-chain fatty acid--CoA ligase [Candidatus Omnitrophica bacterium]|nr:long-chain fatty acid--CoA ligase [Candidatus Omnitrophota bacterium]